MASPLLSPAALRRALAGSHDLESVRKAIAHLPTAVLVADRNGSYVAANEAASRLTRYTVRELLQKAVPDLTGAVAYPEAELLWRAFMDQGAQSGEYELRQNGGTTVRVHYVALANVVPGLHVSFLTPGPPAATGT